LKTEFERDSRMHHQYQIIILGNVGTGTEHEITGLFFERLKELKLKKRFYEVLYSRDFDSKYKGNQPTYTIYIGGGDDSDVGKAQKLIKDGKMVLPLYQDSFSNEIPNALENQNGLKYSKAKCDKVVNLILESFGGLRNTRKVFVSYRRNESTSVAIQLYEALESNNFDVFLDTHSIKQGEPFQDELWHRMTDCDVIVLLNTEKFLESKWCKAEIAEASAKQIGVIQLVWPDHELEKMAEICQLMKLTAPDFVDSLYSDKHRSKLTRATVDEVVQTVESLRARNLASRQDNLINTFLKISRKAGKTLTLQPERYITEDLGGDERRIFIPSVGIPQSTDYNQSSELKKEIKDHKIEGIYLLYDNLRIREKWLRHLDYLNEYLDVKTIKKQDFQAWLKNN